MLNASSTGIWNSVIGAVATIIAAILSAGFLGKIIHKEIAPNFFSYSEPRHNLWRILRTAKSEIAIVVAYGDKLLETQKAHLLLLLRKGIQINYLMLAPKAALDMSACFMQPPPPGGETQASWLSKLLNTRNGIENALNNLEELLLRAPEKMLGRVTELPLTASYIAVDLPSRFTGRRQCSGLIQMMVYQYGVRSQDAPITYLTCRNEGTQFESTADSIEDMWFRATPIDINKYREELDEELSKSSQICYEDSNRISET